MVFLPVGWASCSPYPVAAGRLGVLVAAVSTACPQRVHEAEESRQLNRLTGQDTFPLISSPDIWSHSLARRAARRMVCHNPATYGPKTRARVSSFI